MKHRIPSGLSRRDCLSVGVMGLTGLTLTDFLQAADSAELGNRTSGKSTADSVLFVNLAGGPSHLDTLDMKPEGPSETRGEFKPINTKISGLTACEYLPEFAKIADQFTLLRGISHTSGSHPLGQSYISTGNRPTPALQYPSYGSIVGKELGDDPTLPPYVAIPTTEWTAGYLGDANAPLTTNAVPRPGQPFEVRGITLGAGLTVAKVQRRQKLLAGLDRRFRDVETNSQLLEALDKFGEQAHGMITSARSRAAFDVSLEPESIQKLFGADELNQSLLLGCRLIESGVKFVTVTNQGWDTHLKNFDGHRRLIPPLDRGIAATLETLKSKGLLARTLVVIMGEFGRTPKINENVGRDHFPRVNWCLMAGGGVKPGQLIGGTDQGGTAPDESTNIKPDDIAASLYQAVGIDIHGEYFTTTGRPVMIVPQGTAIEGLFG
ncbi:MAG: DUF1501 domain-containing protein [Planctomycetota bacterium]|nr:DUF1501 domain-containing protein [Planctomycetota bacterium]